MHSGLCSKTASTRVEERKGRVGRDCYLCKVENDSNSALANGTVGMLGQLGRNCGLCWGQQVGTCPHCLQRAFQGDMMSVLSLCSDTACLCTQAWCVTEQRHRLDVWLRSERTEASTPCEWQTTGGGSAHLRKLGHTVCIKEILGLLCNSKSLPRCSE